MQAVPYFTLKKLTEISDSITAVCVPGLPAKMIMEMTILAHIVLCSDAIENNEEHEWMNLLEKTLAGCGWYEKANIENATKEVRRHLANTIIFFINFLIKTAKNETRFIPKSSHLKTRIAHIREGNKKIPS
ncbi:MAG: hypothetical protein WC878_07260 [Candidatus Paceibacterota bacterium]|jgi:hypothetical protein